MDTDQNPSAAPPADPAGGAVLCSQEMAKLWPDFPPSTKNMLLTAAGRQWFDLWQSGFALAEVPAAAWGWHLRHTASPLAPPSGLRPNKRARLSQPKMIRALADWLHSGPLPWTDRDRARLLTAFMRRGALDRAARRQFAHRVARAARGIAYARAREVYRDVLEETKHHCRQSVDCRGIWLPDGMLSADEIRHGLEAALRAPDAFVIKHSDIALVVRSHFLGELVVIKRHRFASTGKRLKYLWRLSRARRAWAAGIALRRLGLPAAEPLGLLETIRGGRVTDSYIITRWLPDCRTARVVANSFHASRDRRIAMDAWRAAWLRLLDRGMYHADTKLSNAMVQARDGGGSALFWTDLECVEAGAPLTPYRVLRNVVQMNGSLGAEFSLRDRLYFLRGLPARWVWLRSRWCQRIIATWTARRNRHPERGP